MYLIKDAVVNLSNLVVADFCSRTGVKVHEIFRVEENKKRLDKGVLPIYSDVVDFAVAGYIANQSQTFLFDRDLVLQLIGSVDQMFPPGDYPAPFPYLCFQFSGGIDERQFTSGLRSSGGVEDYDEILGLFMAMPDQDVGGEFVSIFAWYKSTSINRSQIRLTGSGAVDYSPMVRDSAVDESILVNDKQRVANLAMLCLAHLSRSDVEVTAVDQGHDSDGSSSDPTRPSEKDQYYICRWSGHQQGGNEHVGLGGTDRHASFRFDVAGHIRRLPNGRSVWVKPHQRGLRHERYVPKVYKV